MSKQAIRWTSCGLTVAFCLASNIAIIGDHWTAVAAFLCAVLVSTGVCLWATVTA